MPTFKSATAAVAAANFQVRDSVVRERFGGAPGLPCNRPRHALHKCLLDFAARGSRSIPHLRLTSPNHHNTTANLKVERVNGVMEDVLRSFVSERQDN